MKKTKFWLIQIVMVAVFSLTFGSPVFATPPNHASSDNTVVATESGDEMTHGEMNRLENANLDSGKAEWKNADPVPACGPENPELCTTQELCEAAGGMWFNVCVFPLP